MESGTSNKGKFVQKLNNLIQVWRYSDSQPTEIVLGLSLMFIAPLAIHIELGGLYVFQFMSFLSGGYQLFCVAGGDLNCRVRASMFSFGMFLATSAMYLYNIGFPTPTHYGWAILCLASFGSMSRLIREKIHRNG